ELELEGRSPEGVLGEALRALGELVGRGSGGVVERPIDVRARDLPGLLAAWLEELLFLAETEALLPEEAEVALEDARVTGILRGRRGSPRPLVKGVTLHRLRFEPEDGSWRGRVVLDV
ncbi:MAG: archease, partial [Gaiellaceae bacterium]|nr:archease [Gaiellaceae bacterium]